MGSCISKCKPKTIKQLPPRFDFNNVVIPQQQQQPKLITTSPSSLILNNKISPYPPSPTPSISSISSLTCFSSNSSSTTNTSFSTASSRSPILSNHDYLLWSRYKQNPHVVRINSLKARAFSPPVRPLSPVARHPSPQRVSRSTPIKRVRPASPSPVRQKSFRKVERPPSSPSPSRRFGMTGTGAPPGVKKQLGVRDCGMKKEITCIHRISSKIDEVAAREAVLKDEDFDSVVAMEDIDNPLISLDCFIFL